MEQIVFDERKEYEEFKEELGRKLDETAGNFIVIGYILKQVRDRCLYLNDNYSDIYAFGMGTYGLSKATVSRFMNINTKFSVDGNSREICPEYKGYGRSKLQEMLNIDDSDMELITAASTVDDIRELGKAEKAQQEIEKAEHENNLPLVQMAAGPEKDPEPGQDTMEPFDEVMTAFWQQNMDLYRKVAAGLITPEIIAEEISPSGSRTFRDGVNIMFFYDLNKGLKLRSYEKGKAEITPYTYQELIEKTRELDPVWHKEGEKKVPESTKEKETPGKENVAAPQSTDQEGQETPYVPVPGQTSVSDLPDVLPDEVHDTDKTAGSDQNIGNVIDGEYRELDESTVQKTKKYEGGGKTGEERPYTEVEIKNAISFFDIEYARMIGLQQDTAKRRNYKIALECIRRCYQSIADKADKDMYGTGV